MVNININPQVPKFFRDYVDFKGLLPKVDKLSLEGFISKDVGESFFKRNESIFKDHIYFLSKNKHVAPIKAYKENITDKYLFLTEKMVCSIDFKSEDSEISFQERKTSIPLKDMRFVFYIDLITGTYLSPLSAHQRDKDPQWGHKMPKVAKALREKFSLEGVTNIISSRDFQKDYSRYVTSLEVEREVELYNLWVKHNLKLTKDV